MLEIGADMPDHLCDVTEERGGANRLFLPVQAGAEGARTGS